MCKKTPACDCKPTADDVPMGEGNLASEDEDEPMDSDDDYYSETSSDGGASESEADSATGNRVTPDMIVWLMLKEQGIITQEKYNEKAELCEDDIKSLIPKIPKAESESSDDESGEGEDLLKALLENMARMREKREGNENEGSHSGTKDKDDENGVNNVSKAYGDGSQSETKEMIKVAAENAVSEEHKVTEDNAANIEVVTTHKESQDNIEKPNEKVNNNMQEVQKSLESNEKESIKIEKQQETATSSKHVINETEESNVTNEITVPKCPKCCKISSLTETTADSNSQDENNMTTSENNKNLLNKNIIEPMETNENEQQQNIKIDATSTNTEEESQDVKSETSNQTTNKKTRSFKFILKHVVKEKRISDEYEYVDVLETYVKDLDEQYKNNKASDKFGTSSRELKAFAFFLNFYSPSCYKYIVETFNTPLPEHKELCSWYMTDDDRPGLSERAFKILRQKAAKKRLTCALMSRDIFMKNYGFDYDQVDYGGGCNYEYTDKAVMTFVFVLVSLDEDWKIPIGYIFAKRIPPESQAELIRVCLTQCHEAGVDVVAVTLDSPTPAEFLGCSFQDVNNLKTVFKHPVCNSEVAVWIDPCLAIRSARHTLKVKGVLYNEAGNKVRWNLIRKLRDLYSSETVDFERPKFLELRNHIAKVGLTTEILSDSLAPALQLCEELIPSFYDTTPTRRYIEVVNALYDILNSRVTTNLADVEQELDAAKDYMISLFCNRENALSPFDKENLTVERLQFRSFVEGKPACGFITFLICIESFKNLCTTLVEKERRILSLNPHRLCKDHVENFVKSLRAFNRLNPENFNGFAFQAYYDYLFDVLEGNPNFSDKNVELENWPFENKHSPSDIIKLTSGKRAFDEVYSFQYRPKKLPKTTHGDRATKLVREYSKAMDTDMDLSTRKNMVGYLAGWIAAKFAKSLKCETCIDAMCMDKKQWFHKFITSKHLKGVCLPSEELFQICWECERALRMKTSPARLRIYVLRKLVHKFPWARTSKHHPLHHIHLARAIIAKYIPMRVPAPLNSRDRQRVTEMFSVFTCMNRDGFFSELLRMGARDDDNELD